MLKYKKFELLINLRSIRTIDFVRFNLKKIELAREIFLKEIEHGSEVFIPSEISSDHYPQSMRFYDHILIHLQNNMSNEMREEFYSK